jgi:Tol biopolymer transport system component
MDSGEIRVELERVLASGNFQRSERLSHFLRFVVNAALEAKHEQLKEYVLGVEVYKKGGDFDPRVDSTVRVEAARLRSKLHEYYSSDGRNDPIRIDIPKGGYTPRFELTQRPLQRSSHKYVLIWASGLLGVALAAILVFGLRTRPEAHGIAKPLTTWPGEELEPNFSPDGKQMAMVWNGEDGANYDIYIKPIGEGPRVRLTTDPARERCPVWSRDGRMMAFIRQWSPGSGLYIVPAAGGAERLVGETHAFGSTLDWFPDGQALLMADKNSRDEPSAIYRLSIATGKKQQLTAPPPQSYGDFGVALSPDGRTLAFVRSISIPASDIYVTQLSGGEPRRLTFENQVVGGLAWSADGRSIVFSSERDATTSAGSLWRIDATGTSRPRLEPVPGTGTRATRPAVARQGGLLAYQELYHDANLWRAPASGGTPELVNSSTREEAVPDYSPDGSRIAFNSNRSGSWEVWIANSDGSGARQLTSFRAAPAWSPRWSPDGRLIAFHHVSDGNGDVYTMTPEGSSIRRLTTEPTTEEGATWSKDGNWLYFSSNRSGTTEVWKMAASDPARAIQVTKSGGAWPKESPDGKFLYFRKGLDVWRMPAGGGAETRVYGPTSPHARSWTPDGTGIYFARPSGEIVYYHSETARVTNVIPAPKIHAPLIIRGLSLSPDGRWLLYGRLDRAVSDIMLLENFH